MEKGPGLSLIEGRQDVLYCYEGAFPQEVHFPGSRNVGLSALPIPPQRVRERINGIGTPRGVFL